MTDTQKATPRPWPVRLNKSADGYWLVTAGPAQFASIHVGQHSGPIVKRALDEAFERQTGAQNAYDAMREALVAARTKIEDPWGIPARPVVLAKIDAALAAAEGKAE